MSDRKYLVCAIYDSKFSIAKIEHVKIVTASSPFSAKLTAKKYHIYPEGEKPTSYVASLILGPFKINAASNQTFSCEDLLSIE